MVTVGQLPEEGEPRLGAVVLPAGRRIFSHCGSSLPVAWATDLPVPDAGRVWAALSEAHPETGLVPFLLAGPYRGMERPWENGEFDDPADVGELDRIDVSELAASTWRARVLTAGEEEDEDEEYRDFRAMYAPFGRGFPGLAAAEERPLSPEQVGGVLGSLSVARIGLAVAGRPADVLPRIGWTGVQRYSSSVPVAAMLRSWEERFGAQLLEIGFADIRVLVDRPPRSLAAAERVAAEHFPFCDECGGKGWRSISEIAPNLVGAPIWSFWWD